MRCLLQGPLCTEEIADYLDMSNSNTSRHACILCRSGLLDSEFRGKTRYFSVSPRAEDIISSITASCLGRQE